LTGPKRIKRIISLPMYYEVSFLRKAILFVVNNTGGIDSWHINKLVEDFARLHKMKYKFSQGNVSGILKQLYDRGLIDREQINGKFYYFKRFSNHDRTELGESIAS
jgi:DNA-binding transcriptional ArsR family regulator